MIYRGHRNWLRCNHCRTRRSSIQLLVQHVKAHPECNECNCGGYHYKHRKGSTYCELNPDCDVNRASRDGATDAECEEIRRRIAAMECPF